MEFVLLLLLIVVIVMQSLLLVRKPEGGTDEAAVLQLRQMIEGSESRSKAELRDIRSSVEETIRKESRSVLDRLVEQNTSLLTSQGSFLATLKEEFAQVSDKLSATLAEGRREQAEKLERVQTALLESTKKIDTAVVQQQTQLIELRESVTKQTADATHRLSSTLAQNLTETRDAMFKALNAMTESVNQRVQGLQEGNEKKLELIRATVEEKLQKTLETRIGESFRSVSEQLERVSKGLGDMQNLARGVDSLQKVFVSAKNRGSFGEVLLQNLLDEVLTPSQYESQFGLAENSRDRCDFAIKLPGKGDADSPVFLPIDAKFPSEDYQRVLEAYEASDMELVKAHRKALIARVRNMALEIKAKYVQPPKTTDFAIMYLPSEGLYAEVAREPGVIDGVQRDQKVILCGPTTLLAILNALSLGFRTLAIEQRSSEVWEGLAAVKTEFGKFGNAINEVEKKLQEASNKMNSVGTRTRAINRTFKKLEKLPEVTDEKAAQLLGFGGDTDPDVEDSD